VYPAGFPSACAARRERVQLKGLTTAAVARCAWAPPSKQCELARVLCESLSATQYSTTCPSTTVPSEATPGVSAPLYTLGLLLAFYLLADTAESFFCPTVTILSDMLHLAPNTAGVTLLALGNGAPRPLGAIASFTKGDPHIAMGAILRSDCWSNCCLLAL